MWKREFVKMFWWWLTIVGVFRDCTASRKNQFEFKGTQLIRNMHWVASGHCVEMLTLKQAILTTQQESVVID